MDYKRLNPEIHSASLYEKINRTDECTAYDSRVIYMVSGDLSAVVGGEKYSHLGPGELLYIPKGTPYKLKSKYLRAVVIAFSFEPSIATPPRPVPSADFDKSLCEIEKIDAPFDKPIRLDDMESERDTFIRMSNVFTSAEGSYLAQISAMFKLILLKISDMVEENALPAGMVEALDSYIRENCAMDISNTELGAVFGYHPFYISRMLKERRGITLRQYIISFRLKAARRMLELTDKSAVEIAEEGGFTDASYFAKSFKSAFGETPKEYRNKFKDEFI
ncbi:MAG: helix-turn-helix domain-containing protein [Clostridia bacterium]|nr:helix-turn-helix domain-containing protein [Clostridia bacterium]